MTTRVTADYVLSAGQALSATDEIALLITGDEWRTATISGRVDVTAVANPYPVIAIAASTDSPGGSPRTLTISAGATVSVSTQLDGSFTSAISASGGGSTTKVVNDGTLEVRTRSEAWGVGASAGGFENHGALTVNAARSATGVS